MGYMTVIGVLNDYLHQIVDEPTEFVSTIVSEYNTGTGKFSRQSGVRVIQSEHADTPQLVLAWRNSTTSMSPYNPETDRLIKQNPQLMRDKLRAARAVLDSLERRLDKVPTT